jgi:3-phenylpropionate/trans-cinnamate dioxygenase ferredoxin reductase subunit
MSQRETILIVGGGQAGAWVATTLRGDGFDGPVIIAGAEAHPPYERPPLSKGLLAGGEPRRAYLRAAANYAPLGIELRTGSEVTSLDLASRVAWLRGGENIGFDRLVLATGSTVRRLAVPGSHLSHVVSLRTIDDALALRSHLEKRPRTVIIGGGLIGLEAAAAARTMQCDVTILEATAGLMQRVAPPEIGAVFARMHRDRGVTIHLETTVQRLEGDRRVERVVCADGRRFDADLVIVAIGADPDTALASAAGLAIDNGLVVDSYGRTSHPAVFAAGDVTNHPNPFLDRRVRLESWQNAQNQAIAVGKAMCGSDAPYAELPWFWSDQFDLNLQMAGLPLRWDQVVMRGDISAENFSAFYLQNEHVVAVSAVNRPRDMAVGRRLIERRTPASAAKLADEQIPLKSLLK